MHSTASDGSLAPAAVVACAKSAELVAIALTDHDSVAGIAEAVTAGEAAGIRVIAGCEFSVLAPWGEMHVLGYFLPVGDDAVESFLDRCRADRLRRAEVMCGRLQDVGVAVTFEAVLEEAAGGAVGRPHVARAVVRAGGAESINEAFDRYLGRNKPAYADKVLPAFAAVADLVHAAGGVLSAAHLRDRATRPYLARLKQEGLDAVEVRHPRHAPETRSRIAGIASALDLARTGGSDWHGDIGPGEEHGSLGSQTVPEDWLERLEARCPTPK
jgi:predicted metal-dependent phosphoesterase TrpH